MREARMQCASVSTARVVGATPGEERWPQLRQQADEIGGQSRQAFTKKGYPRLHISPLHPNSYPKTPDLDSTDNSESIGVGLGS